ncbi:MAG: PepSY-like domain-containing protein [Bacteroidales bacterium]|jgi:hypothetical protein|nr:PepSY-like domain-containing protein [Bacteroidales bacterium]
MKKVVLTLVLALVVFGAMAQQKLRISDVPQEVRMGLENTYSDYKFIAWYFETGQYVAEISIDNQVGRCFFTANGNWQFTIFNVAEKELPTLVANYFINNYPGYRIKKSEYVEDFSGDNYYRLIISMKGVGQTEYEMIFDPRGKLTKTNAPDPAYVKKDYIARLNPEDIERRQKKMAERDGTLNSYGLEVGDGSSKKKSEKVEIETPEALEVTKIPDEVTKAFAKKYPRIEVEEWKNDNGNYRAYFLNRQGVDVEALYSPEGMLMSTTTKVSPDRYPRMILKDLEERYPKAKIELIQKVDYDLKYRKSVTDKKLEQYFYVELSEKIKDRKERKYIKLTYDKSFKYQGLAGSTDAYEEDL